VLFDADQCYAAIKSRDRRFDGLFFVGVRTTRIYCRPVCPARTPRRESCRFFLTAAGAEQAGFRPCLRCRPELAPGHAPIDDSKRRAWTAITRIRAEAARGNRSTLRRVAAQLGCGERQLRRLVRSELGVTPVELLQTSRLLTAKQLLTETRLPVTTIAYAAGSRASAASMRCSRPAIACRRRVFAATPTASARRRTARRCA
jgi:AraC family transcriptional regulator of adaptative response / DNA-3-methyladenine glycosylase II